MPTATNQFYYADQGRPILKTEYDDGSEDFYDASGQFPGQTFGHLSDGEVFDPYAAAAAQAPVATPPNPLDHTSDLGQAFTNQSQTVATPASQTGGATVPTPLNPNQTSQTTTPTQPGVPGATTGGDPNLGKNMNRYDWAGNPRQAMINAMMASGKPFQMTNNPYVDRLLSAAPGLATNFMLQSGLGGHGDPDGRSYGDFGEYLKNALTSGSVFANLRQAQGSFQGGVDAVRGYNQAGSSTGDPNAQILQNPFIRKLAELMGMNEGQGALTLQGQLQSPFLTGAQQRPFADMMESRYGGAAQNYYDDKNTDPAMGFAGGNDWFKYLFGY